MAGEGWADRLGHCSLDDSVYGRQIEQRIIRHRASNSSMSDSQPPIVGKQSAEPSSAGRFARSVVNFSLVTPFIFVLLLGVVFTGSTRLSTMAAVVNCLIALMVAGLV